MRTLLDAPRVGFRPAPRLEVTVAGGSEESLNAPPTFVIQCSRAESIGDAYRRYIENRIREAFGLETPMRLVFKERRRRKRPPPRAKE